MKKIIGILSLCVVMICALAFSAFGNTKSSKGNMSKSNARTVQIKEKSEKGSSNAQIASLQSSQLKKAQLTYNLLRAKCLKLSNSLRLDGDPACEAAMAAVVAAGVMVTVACGSLNVPACAAALITLASAVALAKIVCKGQGIGIEEGVQGLNRKFVKSKKIVSNLKQAT